MTLPHTHTSIASAAYRVGTALKTINASLMAGCQWRVLSAHVVAFRVAFESVVIFQPAVALLVQKTVLAPPHH